MKAILFMDNADRFDKVVKIFSSRKKLLKYLQKLHHDAKSLRLKELSNGVLQLLNHNTPLDWWRTDIQEFELDDMEIR